MQWAVHAVHWMLFLKVILLVFFWSWLLITDQGVSSGWLCSRCHKQWMIDECLRDAVLHLLVLSICNSLFPSKSSWVQSPMSHPGTPGVCSYSLLGRCKPEPGFYPVWMQSRTQEHPIVLFCLRWVDRLQYEIAPAACVPKRLKPLLGVSVFLGHPGSAPGPDWARAPLSPAEEQCWAQSAGGAAVFCL